MCELLDVIRVTGSAGDDANLAAASTTLKGIAHRLKSGATGIQITNRVEALDALADCEVTGNGVAFFANFDKDRADQRVLDSNDTKLNLDGTAVILPGGRSDRYVKAYLGDLV